MKKNCGVCKAIGEIRVAGGYCVPCPVCAGRKAGDTPDNADAHSAVAHTDIAPAELRFVVHGEPVGKERPRVFRNKTSDGRVIARAVTPEKTRAYEAKVRTLAQVAVNQTRWAWEKDDRFSVVMKIYRTHHDAGGDLDNVIKILDALNGIVWRDDRYVRGIGAAFQDPDPKNPRVEIEVRRFKRGAA